MSTFQYTRSQFIGLIIILLLLQACSTSGPGLFAKKCPHEQYADKISNAGLTSTALGKRWFQAAEKGLTRPLTISLPYRETGYFSEEKPEAVGLRFRAKRGEQLRISLEKKPSSEFMIYMDLWQPAANSTAKPKLLLSGDSTGKELVFEVGREEEFLLRLQPELLKSGEYTINISTGPSLAFPVPAKSKPRVQSFWGAGRDNGARKHEGIDIFAPFRTPVVASENGRVYRVQETAIGGKVLWLRPENRNYTLYYAHLDSQVAKEGQRVLTGDTLGLMGNTGNARTTAPHLHFGIYAIGGAVDPYPFVNPSVKDPSPVTVSLSPIGTRGRTDKRTKLYAEADTKTELSLPLDPQTLVDIRGATKSWYKVSLPNGEEGFIQGSMLTSIKNPLRKSNLKSTAGLLDQPDSVSARKRVLEPGTAVNILAAYNGFYYVEVDDTEGWLEKKLL